MVHKDQLRFDFSRKEPAPQVDGVPISHEQDAEIDALASKGFDYQQAIGRVLGQTVSVETVSEAIETSAPVPAAKKGSSFKTKQDGTSDRRNMTHKERRAADEPPAHIRAQMGRR